MQNYLRFLAHARYLLAFGFLSIFWGNFGQSFFLGWYGLPIQESLGLSAGAYGTLYSLATLGSGLLILLLGGLIDRWPLRRFSLAAAGGMAAASLAMAAAVTPILLLLGFFLVRLFGQGLLPHIGHTTMARYFEADRGKALSIAACGVPAGEVVLPLAAVALIGVLGWRWSWIAVALSICLLYMPLTVWLLRKTPGVAERPPLAAAPGQPERQQGRLAVLTDGRFWLALPTLLAAPFLITGVFIQQGFILEQKGWSAAWLAACFVVYGLVHWLASLAAGLLIDRFSARRLLRLMPLPLAAAMFVLAWVDGLAGAPLFLTLLGISIGLANTVGGALWAEVYGVARLGSIRSLMSSMMILATALAPYSFGVLIDRGLSAASVFGTAGWAVLLAGLLVQFSYGRAVR